MPIERHKAKHALADALVRNRIERRFAGFLLTLIDQSLEERS